VSAPVFTLPEAQPGHEKPGIPAPQLHFLSHDLAVISNGMGQLLVVATGNRLTNQDAPWKVEH